MVEKMRNEEAAELATVATEASRNSSDIKYLWNKIDAISIKENRVIATASLLSVALLSFGGWGILNYTRDANDRAEAAILRIEERANRSIGIAESYIARFEQDTKPTRVFFKARSEKSEAAAPLVFSVNSIWNGGLPYYELVARAVVFVATEGHSTKYFGANYRFDGETIELLAENEEYDGGFARRNFLAERYQNESEAGIPVYPGSNLEISFSMKFPGKDCEILEQKLQRIVEEEISGKVIATPVVEGQNVPVEQAEFELIPYNNMRFTCEELIRNNDMQLRARNLVPD